MADPRSGARGRVQRLREERTLGRAGLLAALAPLVVPTLGEIAEVSQRDFGYRLLPGTDRVAIVIAVLFVDAALLLARRPKLGRGLLLIGASGFAALATLGLRAHPAQALTLLLGTLLFGAWIYFTPEAAEPGIPLRSSRAARARMAAIGSILAVFLLVGFRMSDEPASLIYAGASMVIAVVLTLRAVHRTRPRLSDLWIAVAVVIGTIALMVLRERLELALFTLLLTPAALLLSLRGRITPDPLYRTELSDLLLAQPARLLVGSFVVVGLAGAVVLSLPICAAEQRVRLLDAVFTAFSAVCVSGLQVLDTATVFSPFGQAIILLLVQLGGLGIMTFATAALVLLGQRMRLRYEGAAIELLGVDRRVGLYTALRRVLIVTGVAEGLGAVLLTVLFRWHGDGWLAASFRGLFSAVSAFCNAGFALQSDSLIRYQDSPLILHTIGLLVIVGGLGPTVVVALPSALRRWSRATLHVRIVLLTTAVLLVVPTCLIGALEWNHSLAELDVGARLHNAWFQALTTRTAGFESVDITAMTPATHTLMEVLMFIGGSPASTAGGAKTTTIFVLALAVMAAARGQREVVWGGWTISPPTVFRAAAIVTLAAANVVFGLFMIQLTQDIETRLAIFEVVSAFGTTGLSIGATASLDSVGKQIVIVCMFIGRVAPLTLFLIFTRPVPRDGTWTYPEQDVGIG